VQSFGLPNELLSPFDAKGTFELISQANKPSQKDLLSKD
jgi:hypothetical protein